jgi:aminoglycoside phosphotransferase family enzyme/predicted kinase
VIPEGQREVADFLARLTGAAPIETHISAVFVGRDAAFKLKKAVDLKFLDFSALARREHFCRRELALNRPHAPGIYRAVHAVTRERAGLALDGAGEVLDWVVEMAPLRPADFLDAVAARGALDGALCDALGDAVHALLEAAPRRDNDAAAQARGLVAQNARDMRGNGLDAVQVARWEADAAAWTERLAPFLAARAAAGFVRRGHGDLHLGNLVLWEGRPVAFDALEFDESFAESDIGYDLAFLLMDLDLRVGRPAANRVMNRVIARSGEVSFLAALPLWMSFRAAVRAHVTAARGGDGAAYLTEALRLLDATPPRLVAVGGVPGTGKTRLARALAPSLGRAPGAVHLRSDEIRKRRGGVAPETRLPPASYAPAESAAVHAALFDAARAALAAGQAVVADAVFLDPAMRAGIAAAAGAARFDGLWLEAPLPVLLARIAARRGDASDADAAVAERAARADPGPLDWARLDATGEAEAAARAALARAG